MTTGQRVIGHVLGEAPVPVLGWGSANLIWSQRLPMDTYLYRLTWDDLVLDIWTRIAIGARENAMARIEETNPTYDEVLLVNQITKNPSGMRRKIDGPLCRRLASPPMRQRPGSTTPRASMELAA